MRKIRNNIKNLLKEKRIAGFKMKESTGIKKKLYRIEYISIKNKIYSERFKIKNKLEAI